jgi:hypothetical protein
MHYNPDAIKILSKTIATTDNALNIIGKNCCDLLAVAAFVALGWT